MANNRNLQQWHNNNPNNKSIKWENKKIEGMQKLKFLINIQNVHFIQNMHLDNKSSNLYVKTHVLKFSVRNKERKLALRTHPSRDFKKNLYALQRTHPSRDFKKNLYALQRTHPSRDFTSNCYAVNSITYALLMRFKN